MIQVWLCTRVPGPLSYTMEQSNQTNPSQRSAVDLCTNRHLLVMVEYQQAGLCAILAYQIHSSSRY